MSYLVEHDYRSRYYKNTVNSHATQIINHTTKSMQCYLKQLNLYSRLGYIKKSQEAICLILACTAVNAFPIEYARVPTPRPPRIFPADIAGPIVATKLTLPASAYPCLHAQ